METKELSGEDVLAMACKGNPNVTYRLASNGDSIAAWSNGRWIPVAGKLITGGWSSLPYELLVNGKPAFDPSIYGEAPEVR